MESVETDSQKLDQILSSVQEDKKRKWSDILSTIMLSLATVISAWCVYQSSQWGGEQYFRIEDENVADRIRMQNEIAIILRKTADVSIFMQYLTAVTSGNEEIVTFLRKRFPPHLEKAMLAWKKTDPMTNPSAPETPFVMKAYVIPEVALAKEYAEKAATFKKSADKADNNSDNYVLISLILSMVLFFSGLSGLTDSLLNQRILIGIAIAVFIVALAFLFRMPVML